MEIRRTYHLRIRNSGSLFFPVQPHGGATVIAEGAIGTHQVTVRVAWCNPKDTYCKKRGILIAEEAPAKIIPLRSLPGLLGRTYREAHRRSHARIDLSYGGASIPNFDNRVFDFLPKDLSAVENTSPAVILRVRGPGRIVERLEAPVQAA